MESLNVVNREGTTPTENGIGIQSNEDVGEIRRHLKEIEESSAFKGSLQSRRFLEYIVEKAIAGDTEALKERLIGAELFGRSPSYNTGDDSIVRVTASHVRKRLLRYYSKYGETSKFYLSLPPGSYLPEIRPRTSVEVRSHDAESLVPQQASLSVRQAPAENSPDLFNSRMEPSDQSKRKKQGLVFWGPLIVLNLMLWGISWFRPAKKPATPSVLPWSAFFGVPRSTVLITSDPDLTEIESLSGKLISVSDYANHHYVPDTLPPEVDQICRNDLIGNKSAAIDVPIATDITRLAQASSREMSVRVARNIQLAELYTNTNFILLGSPRSNPWVNLFNDGLDFRFLTPAVKGEHDRIENVHPRGHEPTAYIPSAAHGITGQTFAIVAFVPGLDHVGQVLLLAGADGEGTEAAGKFAVDLPRLSATLQKCGISPSGPIRHFELLLGLNTIASSPTSIDVIACHILSDASGQRP
jgi:hypothetical protein